MSDDSQRHTSDGEISSRLVRVETGYENLSEEMQSMRKEFSHRLRDVQQSISAVVDKIGQLSIRPPTNWQVIFSGAGILIMILSPMIAAMAWLVLDTRESLDQHIHAPSHLTAGEMIGSMRSKMDEFHRRLSITESQLPMIVSHKERLKSLERAAFPNH